MSFEGYCQKLCAKGHLTQIDVYADIGSNVCDICGSKFVFSHTVDQTNGEGEVFDFEVKTPAKYKTCPTCKHKALVKHETYKIAKT